MKLTQIKKLKLDKIELFKYNTITTRNFDDVKIIIFDV